MSDWQPIETAPKEGQCLLFVDARGNRWIGIEPDEALRCRELEGFGKATHWMPLPDPPK